MVACLTLYYEDLKSAHMVRREGVRNGLRARRNVTHRPVGCVLWYLVCLCGLCYLCIDLYVGVIDCVHM